MLSRTRRRPWSLPLAMALTAVSLLVSRTIVRSGLPYAGPFLALVLAAGTLVFTRLDLVVVGWVATAGILAFHVDLPGLPELYYSEVVLMVLLFSWFVRRAISREQDEHAGQIWRSPVTMAMLLWLGLSGLSAFYWVFTRPERAYELAWGSVALVFLVSAYLVLALTTTTRRQLLWVLIAGGLASVAQKSFTTMLFLTTYGLSAQYGNVSVLLQYRANPDTYLFLGGGFGLSLLVAAALLIPQWRWRVAGLVVYLSAYPSALLSGSRSAIAGPIVAGLLWGLFSRKYLVLLVLSVALVVAGVVYYRTPLEDFFLGYSTGPLRSMGTRVASWIDALRLIREHPAFGVGLGEYSSHSRPQLVPGTLISYETMFPHNTYLSMAAESGVPATLAFVLMLLLAVREALLLYRSAVTNLLRCLGLAALVGFVSLVAFSAMIGDTIVPAYDAAKHLMEASRRMGTWMFLGVVVAARAIEQQERGRARQQPTPRGALKGQTV